MRTQVILAGLVVCVFGLSPERVSSVQDAGLPQPDPLARPGRAEFPSADQQILWLQDSVVGAKMAARQLAAAPDDPATLELLMGARRYDDALKVLRRIVDTRPDDLAAAFKALGFNTREMLADVARNRAGTLRPIVADARRAIAPLPREQAAAIARELVNVDSELAGRPDTWLPYLQAFVAEYAGTEAALLAEVHLLTDRLGPRTLTALDGFVQAHPGTNAAAKALYMKGFNLGHNAFSFGERKGHDPTDRFFTVLGVYRELRSGRYPPSEWVDKAQSLVVEFFAYEPSYSAENVGRMLNALEGLLPALLTSYEEDPSRNDGIGYLIGSRMGELFKVKGNAIAGVEGVFDRLERTAKNPAAVRLLKAEFYLRPNDPVIDEADRPALRAKGQATLESLVRDATGFPQRRALATLATLRFGQGDHAEARDLYRKYLDANPTSDYAWVAALRIGQCEEALGNASAAADTFRRAAQRFASNPVARVLGHAYAARAAESAAQYTQALADYESAAAAWDTDCALTYSLYSRRPAAPNEPFRTVDDAEVVRATLPARISELKKTTTIAGGALVERGRWLLARGRWDEAIASAGEFFAQHPGSPLVADARAISHRARLEMALDLADPEKPGGDLARALDALNALGRETGDFEVPAAMLARATLTAVSGTAGDVGAVMADALKAWQALDQPKSPALPTGALQRDVVEIRNAVFRPKGGGVFETNRWNAFEWRGAASPFLTVDPELRVKSSQGEITVVTAYDPFPDFSNVLFLDAHRRVLLERIMLRIGGTKRGAWTHVMQTPNQPAGLSLDVAALWKKSFWTQPGHWGGWVFESYPIIDEIEFIDAERTKAAVKVTIGYSGATVQMEKRDGAWIAKALTNFWIT